MTNSEIAKARPDWLTDAADAIAIQLPEICKRSRLESLHNKEDYGGTGAYVFVLSCEIADIIAANYAFYAMRAVGVEPSIELSDMSFGYKTLPVQEDGIK